MAVAFWQVRLRQCKACSDGGVGLWLRFYALMVWVAHIFGSLTKRGPSGKRTAERPAAGATVFAPNPFPYDVPAGTEHWVFWMASPEAEWPEERITAAISAEIDERGGGQFAWYPNPKMSIGDPELHHVQCFWRPTE